MKSSSNVQDFRAFNRKDVISHQVAVNAIANSLKAKNESIRATKDRVKKMIGYWVKCGKVQRHPGGFISGELGWLARQKFPAQFTGWSAIVGVEINEQVAFSTQQLGVTMPSDPVKREFLIMELYELQESLSHQLKQKVSEVEQVRKAKLERIKWGKQGGRGKRK